MTSTWYWEELPFERTAPVTIVADDLFPETRYAKRETAKLLANGVGPFCEFIIPGLPTASGVYIIFVSGSLKYVGRAENIKARFYGYGHIAPRNCYLNGRSTNIAMNKRIRGTLRDGVPLKVFVRTTQDFIDLERAVIADLQPTWNIQGIAKQANTALRVFN